MRGEHPFACTHLEIAADLESLELDPGEESVLTIYLPTLGAPLASHSVEKDPAPLEPWHVSARRFDALGAVNLLSSLPAKLPARPDDSLLFWIEATKQLLELLCRGRMLPGLKHSGDSYCARWRVLPGDGADRLIGAMPRSASTEVSAESAVQSFFEECGDALVRSFLRRSPLTDNADSWLSALTSEDDSVRGTPGELVRLERRLRSWAGSHLIVSRAVALVTTFRLREEGGCWFLDFSLKSKGEEKLFLAAETLWQGDLGFLRSSEFSATELQEMLLRDLGRARSIFPPLGRALGGPQPCLVELSLEEAYEFLKRAAEFLKEEGFNVFLPRWWHEPETKLGLELSIESPRGSVLGLEQLLDYRWQISIGGSPLAEEDFRRLVGENRPLVYLHGTWVEIDRKRLKRTLDFLEVSPKEMRLIDALRFGFEAVDLSEGEDSGILPIVGFRASGWLERFLHAADEWDFALEQPQNFHGTLRPYQLHGLSWLSFLSSVGIGCCLADDMGLGKTIQFLALLVTERSAHVTERSAHVTERSAHVTERSAHVTERSAHVTERSALDGGAKRLKPTLLVVPMSILGNWEREVQRFTPSLKVHLHHGTNRLTANEFVKVAASVDIILTTYNLVYRDEAAISGVEWGRIALDEAQNIKNLSTKQTRAVRRLMFAQLPRGCHRVALTGTPLENRLDELWSIFDFLNPSFLGDLAGFRRRFSIPIERFRDKEMSARLGRLIRPFILRRLKSDPKVISDLPEKIEMEELVTLTNEQAALYQATVDQMLPQVSRASGMHRKGLVLAAITRLKQICDHPALLFHEHAASEARSGKLARLVELLEVILAEGDRVLIFSQFAEMGRLLERFLAERFSQDVLFLHGSLPRQAREKLVERFQSPDGPQIFILSLKAGGYGLNLTAATQVIHFDQWWNPAVEQQATDRAHRIGQKRSVQVRRLISLGTLEERIAALSKEKAEIASEIVGSTKNFVTELSVEELNNLLMLAIKTDEELRAEEASDE